MTNLILSLLRRLFSIEPFKSKLCLLKGEAGIVTHQFRCGCILKAEHQLDKHLWTFQYDYSKCKESTDKIKEIMEVMK